MLSRRTQQGGLKRTIVLDLPRFAIVGMGGFAQAHLNYVRNVQEAGRGRHVAQVAMPSDQETYAVELAELKRRGVERDCGVAGE